MANPSEQEQIQLILPFLLLLQVLYFIFKHLKSHNPPLPPGPTPWPIIGNLHQTKNMTCVTLSNLAKVHGPLMSFKLGTQLLIVGSSSAAAEEILKTNDRILSARSVPQSVPLTTSEINRLSFWADPWIHQWKNIRTICRTKLFSNKGLDSQSRWREEKMIAMVEYLKGKEGVVVNVEKLVFATVVNMFSNAFFSIDFISLEENYENDQLRGLLTGFIQAISARNVSDFYPFLGRFDLQGLRKKHRECSVRIHKLWEKIVKERRERTESGHGSHDFLDSLLQNGFSDEQINKLFEELFQAGIDTTTSTISRTMLELLNSQQSMQKLQQELNERFNQDSLNKFHLLQLPYLQACIKETLRLHPPAPLLLSHRAHETCQVMNYTIPKKARVLVNVWAIGRDPAMWDEALEYRPERFLDSDIDFKGSSFQYLPFGAGRRICPGLPMAVKIIPFALASLLRLFDWSLPHGNDPAVNEKLRATSQMVQPLILIPRARK